MTTQISPLLCVRAFSQSSFGHLKYKNIIYFVDSNNDLWCYATDRLCVFRHLFTHHALTGRFYFKVAPPECFFILIQNSPVMLQAKKKTICVRCTPCPAHSDWAMETLQMYFYVSVDIRRIFFLCSTNECETSCWCRLRFAHTHTHNFPSACTETHTQTYTHKHTWFAVQKWDGKFTDERERESDDAANAFRNLTNFYLGSASRKFQFFAHFTPFSFSVFYPVSSVQALLCHTVIFGCRQQQRLTSLKWFTVNKWENCMMPSIASQSRSKMKRNCERKRSIRMRSAHTKTSRIMETNKFRCIASILCGDNGHRIFTGKTSFWCRLPTHSGRYTLQTCL